jgi:hypothetical protein
VTFDGIAALRVTAVMFTPACDLARAKPLTATNKKIIPVNSLVQSLQLMILIFFIILFF